MPSSPRWSTSAARCASAAVGLGVVVWAMTGRANKERATTQERTLFMVILSYRGAQAASRSSVSLQSSVQDGNTFRYSRISSRTRRKGIGSLRQEYLLEGRLRSRSIGD